MFAKLLIIILIAATSCQAQESAPHFANGAKSGEATHNSAIIWTRLTKNESADFKRLAIFTEGLEPSDKSKMDMPTDVNPGMAGQVRVTYVATGGTERTTDWKTVDEQSDFVHQFHLTDLIADSEYTYTVHGRQNEKGATKTLTGRFKTAPEETESAPVKFIVSTCQAIRSIDSGPDGHIAYQQMRGFEPDFFVHTGDILYYDKVPLSKNAAQARAKWNLMFGYRFNREFHQNVTSYFMKDDHDTLKNDCWPGQKYGELTFDQGLEIFREQVPMGESTFRTIRWGKDAQIWLTENRDFRSSNRDEDGPDKTILGEEQKAWLMKSISGSDATYKFVISPGPIVGPDKRGKADNHSNAAFAFEGQQLRDFLSKQKNTFVICGDRHWQYSSKDPETGLLEFGCGPINDEHTFGGTPGNDENYHRHFSPFGGFLGVTIDGSNAKAEWFHAGKLDKETGLPEILHTEDLRQ